MKKIWVVSLVIALLVVSFHCKSKEKKESDQLKDEGQTKIAQTKKEAKPKTPGKLIYDTYSCSFPDRFDLSIPFTAFFNTDFILDQIKYVNYSEMKEDAEIGFQEITKILKDYNVPSLRECRIEFSDDEFGYLSALYICLHKNLTVNSTQYDNVYTINKSYGENGTFYAFSEETGILAKMDYSPVAPSLEISILRDKKPFYISTFFGEKRGGEEGYEFYEVKKTLARNGIATVPGSIGTFGPFSTYSEAKRKFDKIEEIEIEKGWLHFYKNITKKNRWQDTLDKEFDMKMISNNNFISKSPDLFTRVELRSEPLDNLAGRIETQMGSRVVVGGAAAIKEYYDFEHFNNDFEPRTIKDAKVVIDKATNLMWHQSGSFEGLVYDEALEWIKRLNEEGYAGYQDWRLPTWEEAASLTENPHQNDLKYSQVFSEKQNQIWTSDKSDSISIWHIKLPSGDAATVMPNWVLSPIYVRPVRSISEDIMD